jgi:hypothetical protein
VFTDDDWYVDNEVKLYINFLDKYDKLVDVDTLDVLPSIDIDLDILRLDDGDYVVDLVVPEAESIDFEVKGEQQGKTVSTTTSIQIKEKTFWVRVKETILRWTSRGDGDVNYLLQRIADGMYEHFAIILIIIVTMIVILMVFLLQKRNIYKA